MAKLPPPLDRKKLAELEAQGDDGKKLAAKMRRERTEELDALYPEPDAQFINAFYERQRTDDAVWHAYIRAGREMRYMHDELPPKYREQQTENRRFRTRLSNNEVLRTVSLQLRNDYKVKVPATGASQAALDAAQKQSRWAQQLRGAFERKASEPLRRIIIDNQHGDSIGACEFFLTSAYDDLGLEAKREDESNRDYLKRTEEDLKRAGMPFGIRPVDKLGLFYDKDEDGVCRAVIVENKRREDWAAEDRLRKLKKSRKTVDGDDAGNIPDPHIGGAPVDAHNTEGAGDTVECIKYYDRRWYVYMVEGRVIDCDEHMLPDCPIFLVPGIPTGSPNKSEALQGVTWGLFDIERYLNDHFTRGWNNSFKYQDPKLAIETPETGSIMYEDPEKTKPTVIDFSKPGVPQLNPGQKIVNVTQGWQAYDSSGEVSMALQMWERSGLNPIAQGESPGSDPAGYTVNSLQGAAQNLYEVLLDNDARFWMKMVDFCRLVVRDTLHETVYLSVPMADDKEGGTEWLALSPDDVDETPSIVTIDPMGDANRLSVRQSLMEGNARGFVPREVVQRDGFGIDDPRAADKEILLDSLKTRLAGVIVEAAVQQVQMLGQPQVSPLVDQNGQPMPASNPQANGGAPAPTQPPTVGAANAAASQGGSVPGLAARSRGGQDSGYAPPQGVMSPT